MKIYFIILLLISCNTSKDEMNAKMVNEHLIEAIAISDDLLIKMNVLEAAYRDNQIWQKGLEDIIIQEKWGLAKLHMLKFYYTNCTTYNVQFVKKILVDIRTNKQLFKDCEDDGLWEYFLLQNLYEL